MDRARDTVADVWSDDVIAIARAARRWAVAHPARWALLYGSPVPGYHAPAERTVGAGTRVVGAFFDAVAAGIATGDIRLTNDSAPQPMSSDFERIRQEFGFPGDDSVIAKCFVLWAGVVGAISLEVFGQYGADTLTDPEAVFDTQVRLLVDVLDPALTTIRTCSLGLLVTRRCRLRQISVCRPFCPFWRDASWVILRDDEPSRSIADTDRMGDAGPERH